MAAARQTLADIANNFDSAAANIRALSNNPVIQAVPPGALAQLPPDAPAWAQVMFAQILQVSTNQGRNNQELRVVNQELRVVNQELRAVQRQLAVRALADHYNDHVRGPRTLNALAINDTFPLNGLETPPVLPANHVHGQPFPPCGPVPPGFPAKRKDIRTLSRRRLNTLMPLYGLLPTNDLTADKAAFAAFIGCAP